MTCVLVEICRTWFQVVPSNRAPVQNAYEKTRALEALLTRRRQLVDMMVAEKNRYAAQSRQPPLQKNVIASG